jgi:hypothetical protein
MWMETRKELKFDDHGRLVGLLIQCGPEQDILAEVVSVFGEEE